MRETGPVRKQTDAEGGGPSDLAAPYMGLARTLLGQLKKRMQAGGLAQLARTVVLEDGTRISVSSSHGQDTVRIHVSPVVARQFAQVQEIVPVLPEASVPTPEFATPPTDGRFLLIVFRNNQIAAVPMAAIAATHWPVTYHSRMAKSSISGWSTLSQYNFGVDGCESVIYANFDLSGTTLTFDRSFMWLNTLRKGDMGAHPVQSIRTQMNPDPIFNGSGSSIYVVDGEYTVTRGKPSLKASYMGWQQGSPSFITSDGTFYGAGFSTYGANLLNFVRGGIMTVNVGSGYGKNAFNGLVLNAVEPTWVQISATTGLPTTQPGSNRTLGETWQVVVRGGAPSVNHRQIVYCYYKGAVIDNTKPPGPDFIVAPPIPGDNTWLQGNDLTGTNNSDYSMPVAIGVYSNNGVHDSITPQNVSVSASVGMQSTVVTSTSNYWGTHDYVDINGAVSVGQFSSTLSYRQPWWDGTGSPPGVGGVVQTLTGQSNVTYNSFPPALGADRAYVSNNPHDYTSGDYRTVTPYFTQYGYGTYGWMHLSNGRHCMQVFWSMSDAPDDQPWCFVDGRDRTPQLEAAISALVPGATLADVNLMLMDMPLAWIQALH